MDRRGAWSCEFWYLLHCRISIISGAESRRYYGFRDVIRGIEAAERIEAGGFDIVAREEPDTQQLCKAFSSDVAGDGPQHIPVVRSEIANEQSDPPSCTPNAEERRAPSIAADLIPLCSDVSNAWTLPRKAGQEAGAQTLAAPPHRRRLAQLREGKKPARALGPLHLVSPLVPC